MNLEIRKTTSANIPDLAHGHDAGAPDLAQDTGDQKAGLGGGPIPGVGGGPRAHEGGGPTPEIEAAAADLGTGERRKSLRKGQRRPRRATAAPGGLEALAGGTGEAVVHLGPPGGSCPGLHHPDATRRRKRRTRSARRTEIERGGRTGTGAETKENAPPARRRRAKTKSETAIASLIARKET